jgi:hypothetical protein
MMQPHELRDLTARLGAPSLEQIAHRRGEKARVSFYWGCGCTANGVPAASDETTPVRWSPCAHHAAAHAASLL